MAEVSIRDLVRNALRMRPNRVVVGECRGGEALDMLQAMNTGHDGSLTTVHSNSPAVGRGGFNLGRYNNPVIDRRIDEAIATLDPVLREQRTRSLMGDSVADVPILPLFFLKVLTAGRADLTYTTNTYEETLAWNLKPLAK